MEISISEPQSPQSFDSIDGQESSKDLFVIYGHPTDMIPPYSDWIDWQQPIPESVTYIPRRVSIGRIIAGTAMALFVLACTALILYTIIFLVSGSLKEAQSGTWLAVGFVTIGGVLALLLFGAYGLFVWMAAWAEMKLLYTRLRGHFRYGLYLGENALLAWVDREECIGASRSLLKSATTTSRQSGKSTIPVIRIDFIEDTEEDEDVEMGCLEFIGDSLAMADREVVYTVNKWIHPS